MITGRHVLWGLIGGFGVIFIANGTFVYFAASTFPGNDVDDPYRRGLAYNETLAADRAQKAEGWAAEVLATPTGVEILLRRSGEASGSGLVIAGELRQRGEPGNDRILVFRENDPGRYRADIDLGAGRWVLQAVARNLDGTEVLRLNEPIELAP
jgi:nitrogen fixation protein FixH